VSIHEAFRFQTLLLINSNRDKKHQITFDSFKKSWPLTTDELTTHEITDEQLENTWDAQKWNSILGRDK